MESMEQISENRIDKLIMEHYDDMIMPLPDLEYEPHHLISKVRKHYMDYIIKLLSVNYENNQKLANKDYVYLPSAIWRCAKDIEMSAAYTCMVVQIYRRNILAMIKNLKADSSKGKLNKILYKYLIKPPENDKKSQTDTTQKECGCKCSCNQRKKQRSSVMGDTHNDHTSTINGESDQREFKCHTSKNHLNMKHPMQDNFPALTDLETYNKDLLNDTNNVTMSLDTDQADDLMSQLEKLFQGDKDDDLLDCTLYENADNCDVNNQPHTEIIPIQKHNDNAADDNLQAQIKTLEEKLASCPVMINSNTNDIANDSVNKKKKKHNSSKWICEEYYLKIRLHELLDQIGDVNRRKLVRIKERLQNLFGSDSDDEDIISPIELSPEFVISCKERIAPWVVKLLTPFYIKGRIRNKALFKLLAKHLIKLIYQCSTYPQEYEVQSFVTDFLQNHRMIRCEADFLHFKIDNL